ncbi:hypothetical protein [Psychrilyobacter atlanticus]|uniref:hypothetical protein n=1 Tax=Psychrilyobacter atlanticus TaxID=271091 RepID=UPI00040AAA73|nr:hypothetical protein [Psychrilyobacter atlanticus]
MKKKMTWCSLLSLVLLKIFALYKGVKFDILPQFDDIYIYTIVYVFTIIAYLLIFKRKKSLYISFLTGCLFGFINILKPNSPYGDSPENILHALGVISLLVFIVTLISLGKKGTKIVEKNIDNINN